MGGRVLLLVVLVVVGGWVSSQVHQGTGRWMGCCTLTGIYTTLS